MYLDCYVAIFFLHVHMYGFGFLFPFLVGCGVVLLFLHFQISLPGEDFQQLYIYIGGR